MTGTTRILGTGCSLPKKIVSNDNLAEIMDTSDEWIRSRTGIERRHLATEETTTSMCVDASKKALIDAGVEAEQIDLIIVATVSADHCFPSTACEVQKELGANRAVAFDINAACSGFLFAFSIAHSYLQTTGMEHALILGAETLSKMMDWNDRSTCVLFGDGAGAAVLGKDTVGLLNSTIGSDGSRGMVLNCVNRRTNNPYVQNNTELDYAHMDGQEVYKFAVKTVPACIAGLLEESGLSADDINLFLLHQANLRIIESVAKRLKQSVEKFPTNLEECGNISAGSVPILLDYVRKKGMLHKGDKVVLAGFGAGLTWGAAIIEI